MPWGSVGTSVGVSVVPCVQPQELMELMELSLRAGGLTKHSWKGTGGGRRPAAGADLVGGHEHGGWAEVAGRDAAACVGIDALLDAVIQLPEHVGSEIDGRRIEGGVVELRRGAAHGGGGQQERDREGAAQCGHDGSVSAVGPAGC